MKYLLEIIKNKRDNAMRDYESKNKQNGTQCGLCELRGEINAYNDVITLIETMSSVKPSLNALIETFENEKKEK